MKLQHFTIKDLNFAITILTEAENEGKRELPVVREALQREITDRMASGRIRMTEEEKELARHHKRIHTEARRRGLFERPKPTVTRCPKCGSDDWRVNFGINPGEWYEGCAHCRYSQILEVV